MIPSPGRVVLYTLTEDDAQRVNRRRPPSADAMHALTDQIRDGGLAGVQVHSGNPVRPGETFPMVIVRVWDGGELPAEATSVNGQVLLDGTDTLWVTSPLQDLDPQAANGYPERGRWAEPPRVGMVTLREVVRGGEGMAPEVGEDSIPVDGADDGDCCEGSGQSEGFRISALGMVDGLDPEQRVRRWALDVATAHAPELRVTTPGEAVAAARMLTDFVLGERAAPPR